MTNVYEISFDEEEKEVDLNQEQFDFIKKSADETTSEFEKIMKEMTEVRSSIKRDIDYLSSNENSGARFFSLKSEMVEKYASLAKSSLDAQHKLFTIKERSAKLLSDNLEKQRKENKSSTEEFNPSRHARRIAQGVNKMLEEQEDDH